MKKGDRKPRILVFACGDEKGGGSGFEATVKATLTNPPILDAKIVAVISNHERGGVYVSAKKYEITFDFWAKPNIPQARFIYAGIVNAYQADLVMLSGWIFAVDGLPDPMLVNMHPALLNYYDPSQHFGGKGFHGLYVHEKVLEAYRKGLIQHTGITMHFVPPISQKGYDSGPIICKVPVDIYSGDTPEILQERVKKIEHFWQPRVLNHIVHEHIQLINGKVVYATRDLRKIMMPMGYDENIHIVAQARR